MKNEADEKRKDRAAHDKGMKIEADEKRKDKAAHDRVRKNEGDDRGMKIQADEKHKDKVADDRDMRTRQMRNDRIRRQTTKARKRCTKKKIYHRYAHKITDGTRFLLPDGNIFLVENVCGDGNCFLHSVCDSPYFRETGMTDHRILRANIATCDPPMFVEFVRRIEYLNREDQTETF
ncbi:hypothetical protein SARC_10347 [Sphaeroforma arctica JP610]|uniref:OTU domain-containing protein n=1 Tax=Sphaeroforma arctica JP610 TaxID=667725 RepID=A0A0L0FMC4_9EUKA|nr:hypothetical protein SARC_10347 [Sphaeroforma arctica JP610]KNC77183.1 hypothetical protein SARC_10347 [Sphaeroforma arctica JP610]|eukprot:XP_014151085.1 hypothetical protein SARC_10347 [Sphaeroforma arctica JP610]